MKYNKKKTEANLIMFLMFSVVISYFIKQTFQLKGYDCIINVIEVTKEISLTMLILILSWFLYKNQAKTDYYSNKIEPLKRNLDDATKTGDIKLIKEFGNKLNEYECKMESANREIKPLTKYVAFLGMVYGGLSILYFLIK